MDPFFIVTGATVGFVIGLTGVGGGSLMTPILVLGFHIPPAIAVGTDLLYAAITKSGGVFFHQRQGTVDWKIVTTLGCGSIPASILTIFTLSSLSQSEYNPEQLMMATLSLMLIITSVVVFMRNRLLSRLHHSLASGTGFVSSMVKHRPMITFVSGIALGILVTLSSVGAGAIGSAILFILYPRKPAITIVGTDLAHAIPLTAIAGFGHMQLGSVDIELLAGLLLGGVPAIYLGSLIGKNMPDRFLRPIIATVLLSMGLILFV